MIEILYYLCFLVLNILTFIGILLHVKNIFKNKNKKCTPQEEAGPPYLKVYRSREEVLGFWGLIIRP
jgi:hypothetical protein